ncbi:GNAT family N-acetyltransferase [Flavobacterium sp. N502540]|uniref:GNAT family N-acetyltransferase n=1 Tax=Flavobacterium sp. N502540 TaxID=2986838 RepID=UPI0022244332|nr:GNAT family N-acetyltransferase [Flavobacterium sp. N502540]
METTIREYLSSDYNDCIEAFKSNVPDYFASKEVQDFENFLERIEKGKDNVRFFVVQYNQKVIGCGGFADMNDDSLFALAWGLIHKDFHGRGFGEKLLQHRIEQIRQINPEFSLIIDTTQYVKGFFEKHGFRTTKVTNDYYTIGMHRHDMILQF